MTPAPDDRSRFFGDVLTFGWVLPAAIATGAGLGWLLDRWIHTFPVATIVMGLVGAAGGLVQVYRESNRLAAGPGENAPPAAGASPTDDRAGDDGEPR